MPRNTMRRSFTVEVKSSSRQQSTIIPSRVPPTAGLGAPAVARWDAVLVRPEPEMSPDVEARRVLPSLISAEVPPDAPEAMPIEGEPLARRGRGRPRKQPLSVSQAAPEPPHTIVTTPDVGEPTVLDEEPAEPATSAISAPGAPRRNTLGLGRGEKWKRRLRWR